MPPQTQTKPQEQAQPLEPYRAYLFRVDIDANTVGHFTECEGMGVIVHPIPYREGGAHEIVHQLVGTVEYLPVRLRFGVVQGHFDGLWTWLMGAVSGNATKKSVSIVMLDAAGQDQTRWNLNGCWASEWKGGKLDALGRQVLLQELVLVYDELKRDAQPAAAGK
jgi:phage tail-like protein